MRTAFLNRLRDREDSEHGFTLIELMVVVLIIAILLAIAIPTFLGARTRAQNRAAQSDLRNALTASKTLFSDSESYSTMTEAQLEGVEPSIDFAADAAGVASASQTVVDWAAAAATQLLVVKQSKSGTWYCISDTASAGGGTKYGSGAAVTDVDTMGECTGASW
jgi:type IV pilus assembly protein PilA